LALCGAELFAPKPTEKQKKAVAEAGQQTRNRLNKTIRLIGLITRLPLFTFLHFNDPIIRALMSA